MDARKQKRQKRSERSQMQTDIPMHKQRTPMHTGYASELDGLTDGHKKGAKRSNFDDIIFFHWDDTKFI
jgi:hypothetical protein